MNKIMLFLAGLSAYAAFAPAASAMPLFSRQTGMACSACHFQHFPMLNNFGRSFKSAAYTMMGTQAKVEGDGLSIPGALNMAGLAALGYEKSNVTATAASPLENEGKGLFYAPGNNGELSLFFGGRINDNAGVLAEVGMMGGSDQTSAKMPVLFEVMDGTRAGLVPFVTNGLGASYGFELLNTGANAALQMSPVSGFNGAHSAALSAQQYIGTGAAATGVALVANSPIGFINLTRFNQLGSGDWSGDRNTTGSGSAAGGGLDSLYVRLAHTYNVLEWDTGVGIQYWSGSSINATGTPAYESTTGYLVCITPTNCPAVFYPTIPATYGLLSTKATAIDGQLQGAIGAMPVGIYASYAKAPAVASVAGGTLGNAYNFGGTLPRSSINVSGEVGVLPEKVTLGLAIRRGKSGVAEAAGGANTTDNAIMLTATYSLSQNMMLSLSHTSASGSYWDRPSGVGTLTNAQYTGSKTTTFNLFTAF